MELSDSGYLEAPTLDWLPPCSGAPAGQILHLFLGLPLGAQALGQKHSHGEFPRAGGAEAAGEALEALSLCPAPSGQGLSAAGT